ncbi:MAG: toll/interleukin-1 receptor domain-containing protein [Candidatus Aminicenantes bacterium]|nr:toll/interleukin-1 receptor domain-containing protein [Candidatus Aminicenantes bacterium]
MKKKDWITLLHSIHQGNCILMLGPDIECVTSNGKPCTLQNLLSQTLADDLESFYIDSGNLNHTAQLYNAESGRNALEPRVVDFYFKKRKIEKKLYSQLASLPFHLIINSTHDLLILDALKEIGKSPIEEYYHFRGERRRLVQTGDVCSPLVYYIYGSIKKPESLVLTEDNLLELLVAVISNERPLPDNIRSKLRDKETSFLFLGFGFKHWYLRILLYLLTAKGTNETRSFAFENFHKKYMTDFQQIVLFYKNGYKIEVFNKDVLRFVDELSQKNKDFSKTKKEKNLEIKHLGPIPKVFISYASDDQLYSEELHNRLVEAGIEPWLDKKNLRGGDDWDDIITDLIRDVDYFIIIQSETLSQRNEGYVNVEIKAALKRQKFFRQGILFFVPVRVDSSMLRSELKKFHVNDLRRKDGYKDLIDSIKRDFQLRQRG